jgi:hypothetical protein
MLLPDPVKDALSAIAPAHLGSRAQPAEHDLRAQSKSVGLRQGPSSVSIQPARITHDLFLDPGCMGKGYGSSCGSTWIYAVEPARDLGYRKLILTADPHSEPFIPAVVLSPSAKKPPPRSLAGSSLSWSIHSLIASPEQLA